MQIKLRIALAAALALASFPVFAADMPADGTKNFSAPSDAPSYFTNETVPESARVDHAATFDREDLAEGPAESEVGPAVSLGTGRHGRHASAHRSTRHGGSTHYTKATSSKSTGIAALHKPAVAGSRPGSAAKGAGRGGTQTGASKPNTTKHARAGVRQHAAVIPSEAFPLVREA